VILIACLSAVISAFSPFWGLIIIFALGVKYQDRSQLYRFYSTFFITIVILYFGRLIDVISFSDILIGVALSSYLYFRILLKRYDYLYSILSIFIINLIYGVIRHLLFSKRILLNISIVAEEYMKILQETIQDNSEKLMFISDLLETMKTIMANYYPGIWVITIIAGIYIGSLIISAKMQSKWSHKIVRLPYELVYFLIIVLGLFLIDKTRIFGINGILMLIPLFIIQGMSILDFYWGEYIRKAKILIVLMVIAMVFNPYLIIIIAVLGLTDMWFNFRKIIVKEEINENNLN